jgi:hypothetical protein
MRLASANPVPGLAKVSSRMKADEQKPPAKAGPSDRADAPSRSYARQIDCGRPGSGRADAPSPHEVENGRGTGRLRNPPEDH